MLRVCRHLEAPFVLRLDAVLLHQPFHTLLARRIAPCPQFPDHARAAIRTFEFGMNSLYQCQHLPIRQAFPM